MKKLVLMVLFVVLLSFVVSAASLKFNVEKDLERVPAGEEVEFTIYITNNQLKNDVLSIKADELNVYPFSDVVENVRVMPSQLDIQAHKVAEVKAVVKTLESARPNTNHVIDLRFKSLVGTGLDERLSLRFYVLSPQDLIEIKTEIPNEVVPGVDMPFGATFKNNANVDLEDLDIFITSSTFSDEQKLSLKAGQEVEKELRFKLPSSTEVGKYTLNIRVYQDGELKGVTSIEYNVVENIEEKESTVVEKGFLSSLVKIVKTNEGNSPLTKTVKYPVGSFQKLFTNTNPKGRLVEEGDQKYYVWEFTVQPADKYVIEIVTDYKILFIILVVVIGAVGIYLFMKHKHLELEKKIFHIGAKENVSELKILLHVRNKTDKDIHHIKVIDLLPNFIKLDTDFGTLKPISVQRGMRGMRLVWEINSLEPGEERIISYKANSKLHVVGKMTLPEALVQYALRKGKLISVKSNRLSFMSRKV